MQSYGPVSGSNNREISGLETAEVSQQDRRPRLSCYSVERGRPTYGGKFTLRGCFVRIYEQGCPFELIAKACGTENGADGLHEWDI